MEWLELRLQQAKQALSDQEYIAFNAEALYLDLWTEFLVIVSTASKLGIRVITNGLPNNRKVVMVIGTDMRAESPTNRCLDLKLHAAERKISAHFDNTFVDFSIVLAADGVLSLSFNNHEISITEAARKCMEPFLFEGGSPLAVYS